MEKKFTLLNKKIIAVLCSISMVLTLMLPGVNVSAANSERIQRYSVLLLDASGSMKIDAMESQKESAIKFCKSVLNTADDSKVALVRFSNYADALSDFTKDEAVLEDDINQLYSYGGTNINDALKKADDLLNNIPDGKNVVKNIILCTDGCPESGDYSYDGYYNGDDYEAYQYANSAYETAENLKPKYSIYTLGFFHSASSEEMEFGRRFLNDIQNAGYYEVTDPSELKFTFGNIADEVNDVSDDSEKIRKCDFYYDNGYKATCYYSDKYFNKSAYDYDPHLATLSLSFAMSSFANAKENDYKNKSSNATYFLENVVNMPKESIAVNNWYTKKPSTDSIGAVAGSKKIKSKNGEYTLVALGIRGGGYEAEWAGNFTIGRSGQHKGFNTAKEQVLDFLEDYIKKENITGPVKLWITGFSRAAATTNLVAGALDSGRKLSSAISYDNSDIFAYCFEAPAGALTKDVKNNSSYNNIFSIINISDPVPYVAPAALGFSRYGVDRFLPSRATTAYDYDGKLDRMLKVFNSLESTKGYIVDDFQMKKIRIRNWFPGGKPISFVEDDLNNNYSQGVFLSNYITLLSKEFIKDRDNYVKRYEDEIREVCKVYFGSTPDKAEIIKNSMTDKFKNNWGALVRGYLNPFVSERKTLQNTVSKWLNESLKEAEVTDYSPSTIEEAGVALTDLVLALITNHPNYFATAVSNGERLGAAHYPELCYSWLASMDDNFYQNAEPEFNNGAFKIIRINCPVDVKVYDKSGISLASISNERPERGDLISGVNEEGEKYVVLPADAPYDVVIKGREAGKVNVGINEYSQETGDYNRVINYFNLDVDKGEILTAEVPAENKGDYKLKDDSGKEIKENSDLQGKEASEAYYSVKVKISDEKAGTVSGGGEYLYGNFAKVTAYEAEGFKFTGWYNKDKLLSKDREYRFPVKEDSTLTAKFTKAEKNYTGSNETTTESNAPEVSYNGETTENVSTKSNETKTGKKKKPANLKKKPAKPKKTKFTKVKKKGKNVSLKWKKQSKHSSGYEIQYAPNKKFSKKNRKSKYIKNSKKITTKVPKLKSKKQYFRIRTYKVVKGKKIYSPWSKTVSLKLK